MFDMCCFMFLGWCFKCADYVQNKIYKYYCLFMSISNCIDKKTITYCYILWKQTNHYQNNSRLSQKIHFCFICHFKKGDNRKYTNQRCYLRKSLRTDPSEELTSVTISLVHPIRIRGHNITSHYVIVYPRSNIIIL